MSVVVRGLQMPKVCTDCPYLEKEFPYGRCRAVSEKGRRLLKMKNYFEYRDKDCPLFEIKAQKEDEDV